MIQVDSVSPVMNVLQYPPCIFIPIHILMLEIAGSFTIEDVFKFIVLSTSLCFRNLAENAQQELLQIPAMMIDFNLFASQLHCTGWWC